MSKGRVLGFDLARVIAIVVVIGIYHNLGYAGRFHKEPSIRVLVYSSLGVFTFLSAFLLSSKYEFDNRTKILDFYKRRVFRVWPLFVVSSLMLYIIKFNALIPTIKGIFGVSPYWKPHPTTMWYVAMLLSLYVITPFVSSGGGKSQLIKAFVVMTVLGIIQIAFNSVVPRTFNYFTVYLIGLLLGKNYYQNTISFLKSKKTLAISLIWLVLVFIVFYTKSDILKSIDSVIGIIAILNVSMIVSENKSKNFIKIVLFCHTRVFAHTYFIGKFYGLCFTFIVQKCIGWFC